MSGFGVANSMLPPQIKILIRGALSRFIGFVETDSWSDAQQKVGGYESSASIDSIVQSISAARQNIAQTQSLNSRDLQIISGIAVAMSELKDPAVGTIRIMDVGGAGGDYFFTLKKFMPNLRCEWIVVETPQLVHAMREASLDEHPGITWVQSIEEIEGRCHITLLSSVLQYVDEPYQLLHAVTEISDISIINRIPLTRYDNDRCAVQRVRTYGRRGAYPARFFSESVFFRALRTHGEIIARWNVPEDRPVLNYREIMSQGVVLRHTLPKSHAV